MNAALLGLSAKKTAQAFDSIVEFPASANSSTSLCEPYSSGMYVRLAFAVAVHVDPDILIVDEVLSVGDQAFQQKCTKKILEFKRQGKTLMFVSHSANAVQDLCERALWLDHGELVMDGDAAEVVAAYEGQGRLSVGKGQT